MLKDDILLKLEKNIGKFIVIEKLTKEFLISKTTIRKIINILKSEGYAIKSSEDKGYRLNQNNDILSEYLIKSTLVTNFLGNTFKILKTIDSTNKYLKKMNFLSIDEGYVVLSDEQTAGKGRQGKKFYSPKKEGIYLSLFLKPTLHISDLYFLTLGISVAVAKAIEKICGFSPQVKWVNDLYYKYKKLCGILTEATLNTKNTIDGVIIGIGINTGTVNKNITTIATSIEEITGRKGFRNHLISEILNYFEVIYEFLQRQTNKGKEYILSEYKKRFFLLGHQVWIIDNKTKHLVTILVILDNNKEKINNILKLFKGYLQEI